RRDRRPRGDVGVSVRAGGERPDEPGGADRGRARRLLLDGALPRARPGGHAPGEPARRRDLDLRPRHGHHGDEARRDRPRSRARRGRLPPGGRRGEGELPRVEGARRERRHLAGGAARELARLEQRDSEPEGDAEGAEAAPRARQPIGVARQTGVEPAGPRAILVAWPTSRPSSPSWSAPTARRRSDCPTPPSSTTTGRRPRWAGG